MKYLYSIALFLSLVGLQTPTGEEILRKCEKNMSEIADYTVDLEAAIDMERVRMPNMKATMFFKKPDKTRLKSDRFMMLPREGFGTPIGTLIRRYDAELKGTEEIDGISCYRLQLTAKSASQAAQAMTVWVDRSNFTVIRTSTVPYRGRTVTVRFEYALIADRYWLPVKLVADFVSLQRDTSDVEEDVIPMKQQLQEFRRPPRNGSIEIRYENYRINTGLSDDLFRQELEE